VHTKNTLSCFDLTGQNRKEREQKKNHFSQLVLKGQAAKKKKKKSTTNYLTYFIIRQKNVNIYIIIQC
jgi:hypothetical protein